MKKSLPFLLAAVAVGGAALMLARRTQITAVPPTLAAAAALLKEADCPQVPNLTYSLSGPITAIPEYHDCQRLIKSSGTEYGPRVGLYVREGLEKVVWPDTAKTFCTKIGGDRIVKPPTGCTGSFSIELHVPADPAVAVALIHNLDQQSYDPLKIEPGFSCLYLESVKNARLVKVASEAECNPTPVVQPLPEGMELQVQPQPAGPGSVPAAGRWGWSTKDSSHYVVMACPGGWCEIGPQGFTPDRLPEPVNAPADFSSRYSVEPWGDIQRLAELKEGRLVPGLRTGYSVPVPSLGTLDVPAFTAGDFVQVAWLYLSAEKPQFPSEAPENISAKYWDRFALGHGSMAARLTELSFCAGDSPAACRIPDRVAKQLTCEVDSATGLKWYAKVVGRQSDWFRWLESAPFTLRPTRYHCIRRCDHSPVAVLGTVRWNWVAKDETLWARCASGCCQLM